MKPGEQLQQLVETLGHQLIKGIPLAGEMWLKLPNWGSWMMRNRTTLRGSNISDDDTGSEIYTAAFASIGAGGLQGDIVVHKVEGELHRGAVLSHVALERR